MIRLPERAFQTDLQRVRDDLAAAWEHLAAAAEHGASQLEQASRRPAELARSRATALRRAVRGEPFTLRWRWLGAGLVAGVVIGAVGSTVALRRRAAESESDAGTLGRVRERGGAAAAGAREQARTAVHTVASAARVATDTARDTVAKVRDKVGGEAEPDAPESPGQAA